MPTHSALSSRVQCSRITHTLLPNSSPIFLLGSHCCHSDEYVSLTGAAGHTEVAEALIRAKAVVDQEFGHHDVTALHVASQEGKATVVQLLLSQGANANHKDASGSTSLHSVSCEGEQQQQQQP